MRQKDPAEGLPMSVLEEMERYYRARVPHHDRYMGYTDNEAMERLLEPIIRLFEGDIAGRDVLEVACGTGNWTQVLAKRARSVVATDLIEGNLEVARTKTYAGGDVRFLVGDAYSLEGVGGPFDAAFAADWWSHMPRSMRDAFLRALHRCLRPGARVVIVDMMPTEFFEKAFLRLDAEGNEVQLRTLPDGGTYEVIKNFPGEEELRGLMEGWAVDVRYHEDTSLARWVLRFSLRPQSFNTRSTFH